MSVSNKFWRLAPAVGPNLSAGEDEPVLTEPVAFVVKLAPGDGVVIASWDAEGLLGRIHALGVVKDVDKSKPSATVNWRHADFTVRPNPQGRSKWNDLPFFKFDAGVADRYRFPDHFADKFSDDLMARRKLLTWRRRARPPSPD